MRYRGQQMPYDPQRKVRTREHVTADLSYNFLEWKVLQRGHWLDAPRNDYGIDATMCFITMNVVRWKTAKFGFN